MQGRVLSLKYCEEKKNLHTRIAILETKVSIILDERNKMSYRRNEEK